MQEAFYFGPEDREILGVYHPSLGIDSQILTVICPPLYSEFNRSYTSLRNLALALAEKGQHVLRMEYSGTGDSYGDLGDASLANWLNDISIAIEEGRDLSGCRRVRILAVRGSALLACKAAGGLEYVNRFVLWDPVPDGPRFRESLQREQDGLLREHLYLEGAERREIRKAFDLYRMPESMWDAWSTLDLATYKELSPNRLRIVRTPKADRFELEGVTPTCIDFVVNWEIKNGEVFMCQPVLEGLLSHLTEL